MDTACLENAWDGRCSTEGPTEGSGSCGERTRAWRGNLCMLFSKKLEHAFAFTNHRFIIQYFYNVRAGAIISYFSTPSAELDTVAAKQYKHTCLFSRGL